MQSVKRPMQRLLAVAILASLGTSLTACAGGGVNNFDPSDLLDFMDTKKKLPGERRPVFPEGVPGLEQGVPRDLYQGQAAQQDQQAAPAAAAAEQPPPPPAARAKPRRAPKAAARPAPRRPAPPAPSSEPAPAAAPPAQAPAPAPQPAAPAPQPAQPQQTPPPFPAPLPSGSFSR